MKIHVIGRGSAGQRHHANLLALGAASDLVPYSAFSKLSSDEIASSLSGCDGIVVATATPIRLDIIRPVVEFGIPLYVEKPLAFRRNDVTEILASCKNIAERSMVGFMMRYHPAFRFLSELDTSTVYRFAFRIGHDVREWRPGREFAGSYGARPDGGGVLLDLCHEIDMAASLFPDASISEVHCLGHQGHPTVDFVSQIALQTPSSLGTVAMDYLSPVGFRTIEMRGTEFSLEFDLINDRYVYANRDSSRELHLGEDRNSLFRDAMSDFLSLVRGESAGTNPMVPRLDKVAANCMLIAEAWERREFGGNFIGEFA